LGPKGVFIIEYTLRTTMWQVNDFIEEETEAARIIWLLTLSHFHTSMRYDYR